MHRTAPDIFVVAFVLVAASSAFIVSREITHDEPALSSPVALNQSACGGPTCDAVGFVADELMLVKAAKPY